VIDAFGPVVIRLLGYGDTRRSSLERPALPLRIVACGSVLTIVTVGLLPVNHTHGHLSLMPFGDLPGPAPLNIYINWFIVQFGGNIALYMPLGFFVPAAFHRMDRPYRIVPAAVLLSLSIETAQYFLPIGRVAATTDVLMNTTGAACGYLLLRALRRWH
jgi:glycopeptide antibiotics resistance protein